MRVIVERHQHLESTCWCMNCGSELRYTKEDIKWVGRRTQEIQAVA